jgi:hypothetical protein
METRRLGSLRRPAGAERLIAKRPDEDPQATNLKGANSRARDERFFLRFGALICTQPGSAGTRCPSESAFRLAVFVDFGSLHQKFLSCSWWDSIP